jgi:hypothetical protein
VREAAWLACGLALAALGWLLPRRIANAGLRWNSALILDMAGPFGFWALVLAITARPVFAGVASCGLFAGFAFADLAKRAALREPVVFSDMSEFVEIFRHPQLYLPFAGTGRVIAGAAAIFLGLVVLLTIEPGLWRWSPLPGLAALILLAAITMMASREPLLSRCAAWARALRPTGAPMADAARLGPLALLVVYGAIARAERKGRRAVAAPAIVPPRALGGPPIVLIQGESFFDARRLDPAIPADLLPAFDRCRSDGIQHGRFSVSGWGAYTVRAEFAALTGLWDEALGYDRFNPFHAFGRAPIASLAWRLRAEGYRALCLHPFDRSYYGRHKVLPQLGFDAFLGEEAFAGARRLGPYVADAELARRAAEILDSEGKGLFLFMISMENHGPWLPGDPRAGPIDPAPGVPDAIAERFQLRCFLNGLRNTDAMLGTIRDKVAARGDGGLVAFYGDHMPSLPGAFDALKFVDTATDYVIWRPAPEGAGERKDIAAHELPTAVWAARPKAR